MRSRTFNERNVLTASIVLLAMCTFLPAAASTFIAKLPSTVVMTLVNPFVDLLGRATGGLRDRPAPLTIEQNNTVEDLQRQVWIHDRFNQALMIQNDDLRQRLREYIQFEEMAAELGVEVADIKPLRTRVTRTYRHQLTINAGTTRDVTERLVVMDNVNLVGLVTQAKATSATVELITLPGKTLTVRIVPPPQHRVERGELLTKLQIVADKDGESFVAQCKADDPIREGDIAVLDDPQWPREAKGFYVGLVTALEQDPDFPHQFLLVRIKPIRSLTHLDTVFVQRPRE